MEDLEIKTAIVRAWITRGFELRAIRYPTHDDRTPEEAAFDTCFDEEASQTHLEQLKRLKRTPLHPMEEGYFRVYCRLEALKETEQIVLNNKALCLTSTDKYLKYFAEHL